MGIRDRAMLEVFVSGIRFCPFCGLSLEQWTKGAPKRFEELVKAHQRLTQFA
jgi:site-specific recombinase XerC